jgi:hypothetical protein
MKFLVRTEHPEGEYNLNGLPEYRITSCGVKCPRCGATVLRSKQPVDYGGGVKLTVFSCRCHSVAATMTKRLGREEIRLKLNEKVWSRSMENFQRDL